MSDGDLTNEDTDVDLEMLRHSNEALIEAVGFADQTSLDHPTPCAGWDVAELLDHITGGNRFSVNILTGMSADDALRVTRESFAPEHNPLARVIESAEAQLFAFFGDGVLQGSYDHVAGALTGRQVLRLRIHDVCIHIWDLLQAVNPMKGLDPVYVRWAIDELSRSDSLAARHMATGFTQPTKPYEVLLAFGRRRASPRAHLRDGS
jgi:uncharacterized protein (TIGR03086 family)